MKADTSFKDYAKYYDLIYKDKDYEKEVDFIENIFWKNRPKKILEVGCGTGNYTKILLKRGYEVTALDISEDMLKIAEEKCACKFVNSDIIKALNNIHRHLKPNGIFIFDVWNGLAVMRLLPERRVKEAENDEVKVIRVAVPNLRSFDHICEVNYRLLILNKEDNTFKEINEKHVVRFYFPQEIRYYLENAGFKVLKICPFLDLNGKVDETVWNVTVIAKAVGGKK